VTEWVLEYGALGLFLAAFLAATLVPLSSEAALVAALAVGMPVAEALVAASLGNSLACLVNYGLGRFFRERAQPRTEASRPGRLALRWMERWGPWSLVLTPLPVVGDPVTVVAGLARVSFRLFVAVVIPLRVGRYALIAGLL
jgi:membrane protein YqaA with SNARE-associated domain